MWLKLFKFLTDTLEVESKTAMSFVTWLKQFEATKITEGRQERIVEEFLWFPMLINGWCKWLCRAKRRERYTFNRVTRNWNWVPYCWL